MFLKSIVWHGERLLTYEMNEESAAKLYVYNDFNIVKHR